MSEKKYKLKEEVKKYFDNPRLEEKTREDWLSYNIGLEALEEVPQRIELVLNSETYASTLTSIIRKADKIAFTPQEKELCEKALNGELLDIDTLDNEEFALWYLNHIKLVDSKAVVHNIKAVLKEYLKK